MISGYLQLLLHLWGDYFLQSSWMAENKRKHWWPCLLHCLLYSSLFLYASWSAVGMIFATHYLIDRYGLARYLIWFKDMLCPWNRELVCSDEDGDIHWWFPTSKAWIWCATTGYPNDRPAHITFWLMVISDNTLHLTINYLSLRYL